MPPQHGKNADVSRQSQAAETAARVRALGAGDQAHRRALELLPWYVTGTLSDVERLEVAAHLQQCLRCNAALKQEQRLAGLIAKQDASGLARAHGVNTLLETIDRVERRRRSDRLRPRWRHGLAATLAAAALVAAGLFLGEPGDRNAAFSTLSTPTDGAANRIDVVFTSPAAIEALEELLAGLNPRVIGGPSGIGRYTIEIDVPNGTEIRDVLERLRGDVRVRFAGVAYGDAESDGDAP